MTAEDDIEENVSCESLPERPLYVKHYEELEKAQSRIGKTPLKTIQWVTGRLLSLTDDQFRRMSDGDLKNLFYELAVFSLLGTRRLRRIKAGKSILMDHVWGGASWGNVVAPGQSIPSLNETKILLIELKRLVENILSNHMAEITLHETKLVIDVGHDRGELLTFHGRIQDRFLFHLAQLLSDFGARLKRCKDRDCLRIFVTVRRKQLFCSTRCQSRIATRALRQEQRKRVEGAAQRRRSDTKRRMHGKKETSASNRGGSHGKTRR